MSVELCVSWCLLQALELPVRDLGEGGGKESMGGGEEKLGRKGGIRKTMCEETGGMSRD